MPKNAQDGFLWQPLADLSVWSELDQQAHLGISEAIANALGSDFIPIQDLLGSSELAGVTHTPTRLDFVAVPGGSFTMGMSDEEFKDIVAVIASAQEDRDRIISGVTYHAEQARPVRQVQVKPFLCAVTHATSYALHTLDPIENISIEELEEMLEIEKEEPPALVQKYVLPVIQHGLFRMLSDAEWEWIAREGGQRSWIVDLPANAQTDEFRGMQLDMCMPFNAENSFGIQHLVSPRGEWVADGWNDSHAGAPNEAIPRDPDRGPAVHRGAHMCWQDDLEAVTCHASVREQYHPSNEAGLRLAIDLPVSQDR